MNRVFYLLICLLFQGAVMAGDEDMLSPYSQFDPETGFFIPIDEMPSGDGNSHTGTSAVPVVVESEVGDQGNDSVTGSSPAIKLIVLTTIIIVVMLGLIRYRQKSGKI